MSRWALSLPGAALIAAIVAVAPASSAAEGAVAFGQLSLRYQPEDWQVAEAAGGATLTCIGLFCDGAVIDVRTATGLPYCDSVVALAALDEAFPGSVRRAVNVHTIGQFAVTLAVADNGHDPDGRSAVFACVDREGVRTTFQTVVGEDPLPAHHAAVILGLLQGLSALPAAIRQFTLGELVIDYPADRWAEPPPPVEIPVLTCLPPTCDGRAEVAFQAEPIADDEACEPILIEGAGEPVVATITTPAGLTFEVTRIDSMCRAASPSQYVACSVHGRMRYTIATDGGAGCYFGPSVSESAFYDLLNLFRPVTAP